MKETTLILKPKEEYESRFDKLIDESLLDLEDRNFECNEDIRDIAVAILNDYTGDDSYVPLLTANAITIYQLQTRQALGDFEKRLIYRYAFILIYRSKMKVN